MDSWQTLVISKNSDDTYTAVFKNTLHDTKETANMTLDDLEDYIDLILRTITYDEDKTARMNNVQIDMPLFPSVIVKTENIVKYLPTVLEQLNMLHNIAWPSSVSTKTVKATEVAAESEDSESEAAETESEAESESELEEDLKFAANYFKKRALYEEEPSRTAKKPNRHGRIGYEWD